MKRVKNILILINCIIAVLFLEGCSERKIEIRCEETSPNEIYTAYSYTITNGGATVPFSQGVSILESKEDKENILEKEKPNIYYNTDSNETVEIEWLDDDNLKVITSKDTRNIYLKVDIFKFINIQYLDE